jgi:hypothetical protein
MKAAKHRKAFAVLAGRREVRLPTGERALVPKRIHVDLRIIKATGERFQIDLEIHIGVRRSRRR